MKILKTTLVAALGTTALSFGAAAQDQQPVQIAGSSTVLPYAQIVVENFGDAYPEFPTPVLESGGSSAGLKQFCQGVGSEYIDIANASRAIRDSEVQACADNGVTEVQEVKFGYDGIVFAYDADAPAMALTPEIIYKALAEQIVQDGEVVDNTNETLAQVNSDLPEWDIAFYIPASNHGTREVFEEKVMLAGCEASGDMEAFMESGMDEDAAEEACMSVRTGNFATEISGDYTETLARIDSNQTGIGVFGLSFYEQNTDKLQVATINGVEPNTESVASGEYPVSRPLYFYVKKQHIGTIPGLKEYVSFFLDEQMIGPNGPLSNYGLVPAPDAERDEIRSSFDSGETL